MVKNLNADLFTYGSLVANLDRGGCAPPLKLAATRLRGCIILFIALFIS
jgi:hypothetical protein